MKLCKKLRNCGHAKITLSAKEQINLLLNKLVEYSANIHIFEHSTLLKTALHQNQHYKA
jgi:hypothetical protein